LARVLMHDPKHPDVVRAGGHRGPQYAMGRRGHTTTRVTASYKTLRSRALQVGRYRVGAARVHRGCSRGSALPLKRRSARLRAGAEPRVHSRLVGTAVAIAVQPSD